jgi:hypothetical protein
VSENEKVGEEPEARVKLVAAVLHQRENGMDYKTWPDIA